MVDVQPAKLAVGERETVLALLQFHRDSFVRKVEDLSEDDARRVLVPTGTTLLWLTKHLARAEHIWVVHRFLGSGEPLIDHTVTAGDTVASTIEAYRAVWARTDAIAAAAELDDVCRNLGDDPPANLRWVLMHLLEETARHAGHADIIRELIDGSAGR